MTIVSGNESRNSAWANDTSSFGQKMLLKMGWSQGKGLGKHSQGTQTNLRALRREEGLGIGASTDTLGEEGFSETSRNFHGVLANLQQVHNAHDDIDKKKKAKKKKKKDKHKKDSNGSGLTLSQTRVAAGHAQKMRESKDLSKKSSEDMAAIFGMKVEAYEKKTIWGSLTPSGATLKPINIPENEDVEEQTNQPLRSKPVSTCEGLKVDKKKDMDKKKKKRKRVETESSSKQNDKNDEKKIKKKKRKTK